MSKEYSPLNPKELAKTALAGGVIGVGQNLIRNWRAGVKPTGVWDSFKVGASSALQKRIGI